ncbi:MAG TPA: hypothetical protein VNY73_04965, partial [Bacteroidia bacterium]|nr:hypothetical protein [Bacteroidia bacterium]
MNKTLKKIALTCLLGPGLVTGVLANNTPGTESVSKKIQAVVALPKEFKTPGFNEKVKVFFGVDEKGNVTREIAATKNPALRQAVEAQFKQLCFAELSPGITYNVEIKFIV